LTFASDLTNPRGSEHDLASLEERLGLLLIVRLGLVAFTVLTALFASHQVGFGVVDVGPLSAGYVAVVVGAEWYRRRGRAGRMPLQRAVLPLDAIYLAIVTSPSGGPRSQLVILFAVQLIAVTLLVSERAGLRMALWDSFLFLLIPTLSLSGRIGSLLGVKFVAAPPARETALAIMGFWAVALCTAVFSAVSERELRRSKAELVELAAMAAEIEVNAREEEIFAALLRSLIKAFGFRRAAAWWFDANRPTGLVVTSTTSVSTPVKVPETARSDAVTAAAWSAGEPVLVRHLSGDDNPGASHLLPNARNVVVLPTHLDGGQLGIVMAEHGGNPLTSRLPKRVLLMLGQFVWHAELAVRNARLLAERERLAAIDGLTGVANRREFDAVLGREVNRTKRSREPLSLAIFDLDHFKSVNDTHGHLAGDEVLRRFAAVLQEAVRDMDLVARYGGEEFAVILPRCEVSDAVQVVERVTRLLRATDQLRGITVSAGVASLPLNASTPLALVAAADDALFESKRNGRNRYTLSDRRSNGDMLISGS
jgi:two-component system cell cycle response regulator